MKSISKTIKRSEDLYIEFSQEELDSLNIKEGDKFSWKETEDGILLEKFVPLDIEIGEFSRESLEMIIQLSLEKDLPVNDIICDLIEKFIKSHEN